MARDKRVGFRGRHLIRQVLRNKNQNVRRSAFNELTSHLSRRHGRKIPVVPLALRVPGEHRPLTRKARHLLRHLRQARTWTVTRRLLAELHREIEQRNRRGRALRAVRSGTRRVKGRAQATGRAARTAGRGMAQAGRWTRRTASRAQEPGIARAERKQAEREKGTRRPPLTVRAARTVRENAERGRRRFRARRRYGRAARPRLAARASRPPRALRPAALRVRNLTPRTRTPRAPRRMARPR